MIFECVFLSYGHFLVMDTPWSHTVRIREVRVYSENLQRWIATKTTDKFHSVYCKADILGHDLQAMAIIKKKNSIFEKA